VSDLNIPQQYMDSTIDLLVVSSSTFVSVFTIKMPSERSENPWRLNGEDTKQMYSKHLSV